MFGLLFGLALYGLHILYVLSPLIGFVASGEMGKAKREGKEIKGRLIELEEEMRQALSDLEARFMELKNQWPEMVKSQSEKVKSLRERFNENLRQLASGIDRSIKSIFEVKRDYEHLRLLLKTRGLIIERVACPHCGGSLKLPESGYFVKCPYCGENIYAVDVLKLLDRQLKKEKEERKAPRDESVY